MLVQRGVGVCRHLRVQGGFGRRPNPAAASQTRLGRDLARCAPLLLPAADRPFRDAEGAGGLRSSARRPGREQAIAKVGRVLFHPETIASGRLLSTCSRQRVRSTAPNPQDSSTGVWRRRPLRRRGGGLRRRPTPRIAHRVDHVLNGGDHHLGLLERDEMAALLRDDDSGPQFPGLPGLPPDRNRAATASRSPTVAIPSTEQ